MTRFAVYSSDSNTEDEDERPRDLPLSLKRRLDTPSDEEEDEESEEESEESEKSDSEASELPANEPVSPRRRRGSRSKDRKALVEDENGEYQYAHEVDRRVSPSSTSSRTSPGRPQVRGRVDTTVIPWAQHVGVDSQKMHVMQASLFRTAEEAGALRALDQPGKSRSSVMRLDLDKSLGVGRKHRRDSDGDGFRYDSRERASFAHDIDPPIFRPSRKYARVDIQSSVASGSEGAYFDAGLALGRSFRVGWGPGGHLVHSGGICSPLSSSTCVSNSSIVTITKTLPSLAQNGPEPTGELGPTPASLSAKLLQHHLSHTTISVDESNVPFASPNFSSASPPQTETSHEPLNFASFVSLFPSTDCSSAAPIFRLGSALFDPIDLHLGRSRTSTTTPDFRNRITGLRRKSALSKWLEEFVKSDVDADLRIEANGSNVKYTPADAAFTYLSGHQIPDACSKASDGGYFKLATLISQAGGDELFKKDLVSQLDIWKAEKLSPGSNSSLSTSQNGSIGRAVWRIYTLLAGILDQQDEKCRPEDDVLLGLDWKRVFGVCLWYGTSVDASIADAVKQYEEILQSRATSSPVARPLPQWAIAKSVAEPHNPTPPAASRLGLLLPSGSSPPTKDFPEDPLYALIKLHSDPTLSLSKALNPLSFSRFGVDVGIPMCWHLYIILSRVMRVRDFPDRTFLSTTARSRSAVNKPRSRLVNGTGGARHVTDGSESSSLGDDEEDEVRLDGCSPTANLLASSYAFVLESWGMLQEAAFVLLHLEESAGRKKAIKDLLARSASKLDDWMVRGLVGSLKLPMIWVDEAKAMFELDRGNLYEAYELYISAQAYNAAHQIAVMDLAPDAVIRKDMELLRNLFSPLDLNGRRDKIEGWFTRGRVFLDYARIMSRLPQLLDPSTPESEQDQDESHREQEIDELVERIPEIIAVLPDILHRNRSVDNRHPAALEEMSKDLLKLVERSRPSVLSKAHQPAIGILDGASKINLIKGIGYAQFLQIIENT